jgi:hypothetical protein
MNITITLTDYEARVLSAEYNDIDFLFSSQLEGRINDTQNKVVQKVVSHCTANSIAIPSTTPEIVEFAFTNDLAWVVSERLNTPTPPSEG